MRARIDFLRISVLFFFIIAIAQLPCIADGLEKARISKNSLPLDFAPYFSPPLELANDFGDYDSPLYFADGSRVETPEAWKEKRKEILNYWHGVMGPWPPLLESPKIKRLEKKNREDFIQYSVRVDIAPEGQTTDGYLLVPNGKGPFPAVVVPYYDPETGAGLGKELRDFGYQLTKRGFVSLSIGSPGGSAREPDTGVAECQPLSFHAYVAANCHRALAGLPEVDEDRIGIVGHSYGGKWAMSASCLYDEFACAAWSDPGIVFDESRPNVNYWDRWYLGKVPGSKRPPGGPTEENPRTGAYKTLMEEGHDLHELHVLMCPRPFLVSGGAEDRPARWKALNHSIAVNRLLGFSNRVAMTNREGHSPTPESNEIIYRFFEFFLK